MILHILSIYVMFVLTKVAYRDRMIQQRTARTVTVKRYKYRYLIRRRRVYLFYGHGASRHPMNILLSGEFFLFFFFFADFMIIVYV